ncbi:acyclic terpene utilization AtuA family protein [Streptomyces sp. TS71-3]|uniref:acyclic terpene utilization AtuA family protein n=1 Tax=Streptomyces sp. TS71-3 TaxID=2733862 RepID=UPI001BB33F6E|nr:acyclic terpene utilization AtuA family protein [Streptomyces sp. TS71-3]
MRIGNFSGFYGDRSAALTEMLTGGALDVLTGDYLAELTMLILGRDRLRDAALGYAKTFLGQLEQCLGLAHERGVRIVANAGGVNPASLAERLGELADRLGIPARVAHVTGDDLIGRGGWPEGVVTANAYLGGHGIAACLRAGADIVVTGRVTDAALVTGPATAHFGWRPEEYDKLAGAVVAGHVLECGTQATGGNYAFFASHRPGAAHHPGFPLAELHEDGSCVITKQDGTGGFVDTGTVTAQLLYETSGARYAGPDVTARLDTVRLTRQGPDRVAIDGVRGEPPPPSLKVGLNRLGGFRGEVVFVLTGLDIDAKADLVRAQMEDALSKRRPAELRWELARTDHPDAGTEEAASAVLRLVARDRDEQAVGRALGAAAVELALASYPGFHVTAPPGKGTPYGVFETAYVAQGAVEHVAVLPDGRRQHVPGPGRTRELRPVQEPLEADVRQTSPGAGGEGAPAVRTRRAPLGLLAGARSGDKGGDANIGVWARQGLARGPGLAQGPAQRAVANPTDTDPTSPTDPADPVWDWLLRTLTTDRLRTLLPECADLPVTRHVLPNLRALNFVVEGLLGEGVAARHRFDPQAKALGEWLRARHVDIPEDLLAAADPSTDTFTDPFTDPPTGHATGPSTDPSGGPTAGTETQTPAPPTPRTPRTPRSEEPQ